MASHARKLSEDFYLAPWLAWEVSVHAFFLSNASDDDA